MKLGEVRDPRVSGEAWQDPQEEVSVPLREREPSVAELLASPAVRLDPEETHDPLGPLLVDRQRKRHAAVPVSRLLPEERLDPHLQGPVLRGLLRNVVPGGEGHAEGAHERARGEPRRWG